LQIFLTKKCKFSQKIFYFIDFQAFKNEYFFKTKRKISEIVASYRISRNQRGNARLYEKKALFSLILSSESWQLQCLSAE